MTGPSRIDADRLARAMASQRPPEPTEPWAQAEELSPLIGPDLDAIDRAIPARYRDAIPALEVTWSWVATGYADGAGLLLLGPTGTGKTHEAYGAVRAFVAAGALEGLAVFGNVADLLDKCRPEGTLSVDDLSNAALLLLDDLGAFKASEWTTETLYRVVDARWANRLPTLATTNHPAKELASMLGDRLTSRLAAMLTQVPMVGRDRRRSR